MQGSADAGNLPVKSEGKVHELAATSRHRNGVQKNSRVLASLT